MKQLLLLIVCFLVVSTVMSQERINPKRGCRFEGNEPTRFDEDETLFAYSSTPEAEEIVNKILAVVYSSMRESRFVIRAADVPNAEAVVDGDKRLILYNADFMLRAGQQGDWVSTFILAHEIAHHVLGHTLSAEGSRQEDELGADKWAGSIMCGLGANLDEAQLGIKTMIKDGPSKPGSTHPAKSDRIQAVSVGFALARCKAGGNSEVTKPRDTDGDGFADNADDCPSEYGTLKGCRDSDEDGIADKNDDCKYEKGSASRRGCPEPSAITDSDKDGVPDTGDDCKNIYGLKKFSGCPDTDGDNIPDKDDNCPNEKGVAGKNGCPEQAKDLPENLIFLSGGTFSMGSNDSEAGSDERPVHSVRVGDFYIGKYEVTNDEYCAFLNVKGNQTEGGVEWIDLSGKYDDEKCRIYKSGNSYYVESGYSSYPVIYVSWFGAKAYCSWLTETLGKSYSLPTEAQWEYAARSKGKSYKYAWGNLTNPTNKANVADETGKKKYINWTIFTGYTDGYVYTCPVEESGINEVGLYGMSGNVWEWCSDWYESGFYKVSPTENPKGPASGSYRVLRGGSWYINPRNTRCSYRSNYSADIRYETGGFRVVRLP